MTDVVLVEPTPIDPPITFTYRAYAPLALLTVAAPLIKEGFRVKIVDQRVNPNWMQELLNSISKETLCVGITSMTGRQLLYALKVSEVVKQNTDVPVVWGGIHASLLPEQTLENKNVDFVVQGEGEQTFLELLRALEQNRKKFEIQGLWYKENGSIKRNPARKLLDLDTLHRIPFDLVDLKEYDLNDALPVFTSRGCAHRCGFCYNLQYCNRRWRAMSPDRVIDDLKYYVSKYKPNKIIFRDDNFFQDLNRTRQICERIMSEGLKFRWRASCRIDYIKRMTEKDLQLISDTNFEDFGFGMESGSQKMLNIMKKDITIEETLTATGRLRQHGFIYSGSFVGGYPGETEEDLFETIDFVTALFRRDPSFTFVTFIYVPYPGTDAYNDLLKHGFKFPENIKGWSNFHFAYDNALPGVGRKHSFYAIETPWLTRSHKEKLFHMDLLCQVAGRPLYRPSSLMTRILTFPYNLLIHIARYRWAHKIFGPVPELALIDFIRKAGLTAYKAITGEFPKR
ncbi:MAG: B12-binding domain-containing radical SAM protein [Desulfobacteraceae bacterium]|nr:B12-binding domain-containing radical SAM protein [Desulfobacteraceae bacterium]